MSKEIQKVNSSTESISRLFGRRVYEQEDSSNGQVDFAVKSIDFFKETNLNTGTSFYFTKVGVTWSGESKPRLTCGSHWKMAR